MKTQNIKEELNKDMENLRKKNQKEILEIKSPFSQTKKYSGRPLQQTRTSGRQNLRAQRKIEIKENTRNISQTTQELRKEYARTQ
jgi:hypothetical protein